MEDWWRKKWSLLGRLGVTNKHSSFVYHPSIASNFDNDELLYPHNKADTQNILIS